MKIIKIVVDELPICCNDCDFYWMYDGQSMCDILKIDLNHDVYDKKHDLCPLAQLITVRYSEGDLFLDMKL